MSNKRTLSAVLIAGIGIMVLITATAAASSLAPIEELGKAIFFDENLSINQNQSCATCHAPEAGWVGPDSDVNAGVAIYEGSIPARPAQLTQP